MVGGQAIIMPMLGNDTRVHSIIGLSAIKLQGINNETVVLFAEEKLPKSDRSITYGLILDLAKLRMSMCLTLNREGIAVFPRGPSAVDSEAYSRAMGPN